MGKKIYFISSCIVAGICVLLILILNNFKWGRRFNSWLFKIP